MTETLQVLAFAGSLRQRSYNRALLRAARELAPDRMEIEPYELDDLPLYDADVESRGDPAPVAAFKDAIAAADALLIATPEYQHSLSGVLKNALDWASRPPKGSVLTGKSVATLGATTGRGATARAQSDLRKVLAYSRMHVVPTSGMLVPHAAELFDDELRLSDDETREHLGRLLHDLDRWTRWLAASPPPRRES